MNDTHGAAGEGHYDFDLDGTLAFYDEWKGIDHIGEPIKPMVDLIKKLHDEGKVVKILTARVAPRENPDMVDGKNARDFIVEWCEKNLGFVPEITHEKDHLMLELYDDRVKQVVPNKGLLVEDLGPRVEIHPVEVRGQHLDFFDRAAMAVGKLLIWTSAMWCLLCGIPMLLERIFK